MPIQSPSDLKHAKTRLTPDLADYLFSEEHHADSPIVLSWEAGVSADSNNYGDPHPNVTKFPDHVLVYVSPEQINRDGSKVVMFYYAAIGANQDDYNYTYTGHSGSKYKKFTRKYLVLREDIDTEVTIPLNTPDSVQSDYVLYDTRMTSTGSRELDSVFVMREHIYIQIVILNGVTYDQGREEYYDTKETIVFGDYDASTNNGGIVEVAPDLVIARPINSSWTNVSLIRDTFRDEGLLDRRVWLTCDLGSYMFIQTKVVSELPEDPSLMSYGDPHPDSVTYPDHKFIYVSGERENANDEVVVDLYYAAVGTNQDDYNWTYRSYSGSKYRRLIRNYIVPRDAITAYSNLPLNTPDPVAVGFRLYDIEVGKTGSKELDCYFVSVNHTYVSPEILTGTAYDRDRDEYYEFKETIIFGDYDEATNNGGITVTNPDVVTATPINGAWTNIRTSRYSGPNNFTTRSYNTYINYSWPPVLTYFRVAPINTRAEWEEASDSNTPASFYFNDIRVKNGFSGLSRALVEEETFDDPNWINPPQPLSIDPPMIPEATQARGVFSGFNIRATLHDEFTYTEGRGTEGKWEFGDTTWTFPATNYTDWPSSGLKVSSVVSPTAKGWIRKTTTVYAPSV